jgi:hypothetical protein
MACSRNGHKPWSFLLHRRKATVYADVTVFKMAQDAVDLDKADDRARQTPDSLIARKDLINALEQGTTHLDLRLKLTHAQRDTLADDASGDALDATLCLMQAAWALSSDARYGLPADMDPLEGWIVTV